MKGVLAWYTNLNDITSKSIFKYPYFASVKHVLNPLYMNLMCYLKKGIPIQPPLLKHVSFCCLFLYPRLNTHNSNIIANYKKMGMKDANGTNSKMIFKTPYFCMQKNPYTNHNPCGIKKQEVIPIQH